MTQTAPNLAIAIPTFIGSAMSFIATALAIISHIVIPPKKHFRHALIVSLLIADCANSLNNTISGAIVLRNGQSDVIDGGCIANAWVNQITVSAVDWNILIIGIVVLCTVVNSNLVGRSTTTMSVLICMAAWLPGFITSFIGLGLDAYGQVSGNWCWIRPEHLMLRYALTHGWRIAIFFATIGIYTYIYIHLKRSFGVLRIKGGLSSGTGGGQSSGSGNHNRSGQQQQRFDSGNVGERGLEESGDTQHILATTSYEVTMELGDNIGQKDVRSGAQWEVSSSPAGQGNASSEGKQTRFDSKNSNSNSNSNNNDPSSSAAVPRFRTSVMPPPPNLKRMMLMNGYPLAYIILWIPGIANRLAESLDSSPVWLKALQSSTQFVGFVNAVTYGFSEQRMHALKQWWNDRRGTRGFQRSKD